MFALKRFDGMNSTPIFGIEKNATPFSRFELIDGMLRQHAKLFILIAKVDLKLFDRHIERRAYANAIFSKQEYEAITPEIGAALAALRTDKSHRSALNRFKAIMHPISLIGFGTLYRKREDRAIGRN